uniref:NADH dehydrogenase subunit 6 n=1 Tax=Aegista diversifamilia TaxID=1545397 RepID=A0A0U2DW81_AEGDI|nr:NADH dehydrogenase subunit 6 [Aegista diversifamilia]AKP55342.1 NADH dehydrogenase subunit 6 [Aegista diversifamilia]
MSVLEMLGVGNMLFFFLLVASVWVGSSAGSALSSFLGVVMLSCAVLLKSLTPLLPFLQFLVYVGGLLVLLIYTIMLSSNIMSLKGVISGLFVVIFPLWMYLMSVHPPDNGGGPVHGAPLYMDFSILVVMVVMLTFVFLFICQMISIGGRTMNIGTNS